MTKMSKYFSSFTRLDTKSWRAVDLFEFLERYVNVVFPANKIDSFIGPNPMSGLDHFQPHEHFHADIHHVIAYVYPGASEGFRINIGLMIRGKGARWLGSAKLIGTQEEGWEIAKAITDALESICTWQEIPNLVAFDHVIPRAHRNDRHTNYPGTIFVDCTETLFSVRLRNGNVLFEEHLSGRYAASMATVLLQDWRRVLNAAEAEWCFTRSSTLWEVA